MKTAAAETRAQVRPLIKALTGATVLGLVTAGWITVIGEIQGEDVSFTNYASYVMPFWYLWAIFLQAVVWLALNKPIELERWISRSATHLGAALMISVTHTSLRVGLDMLLVSSPDAVAERGAMVGHMLALATLEAPIHLFIYGAILGVTYIVTYKRRLRERELATTLLSEQLALAQVRALRMQINPHFLFNAMNSISMLVRDRKQDAAVKTIAGLSDLLRYVLDDAADQEVPLRRELDFIERYLAIEQIRFQERLKVSIETAENTLDALVPNLVLQPLVENAIRHGVSRSVAPTTITITASTKDGALLLQVADDGPGFSEESPQRESTGLGIANTRKRLTQLYGDDHSLEFTDSTPHGTLVSLSLPHHSSPVLNGSDDQ